MRSENSIIIKVSEDNVKWGNGLEGTTNIGSSKKIEGRLPRKYLDIGYDFGKKFIIGYGKKPNKFLYSSQTSLEAGIQRRGGSRVWGVVIQRTNKCTEIFVYYG